MTLELYKAAEQGDPFAQFALGVMYYFGKGVPQDSKEAVKWFRKAADQGDADAQIKLGLMYEKGKDVPQNDVEAVKWYDLAASQGNEDAIKVRDLIAQSMTPAQIAQAKELASKWKPTKP